MALEWLFNALITLALGALGALMGAILLWKYWALPKISGWITHEGSSKLRAWLAQVIEHPEGEQGQQIGKLTGVAFSYALQGLEELATTKEGRERLAPLMSVVQEHIQQSIFATWGHILRKLEESGESMDGNAGAFGFPPEILGLGEKLIPKGLKEAGLGLPQLMRLAGFLGKFQGSDGGQVAGGSGKFAERR